MRRLGLVILLTLMLVPSPVRFAAAATVTYDFDAGVCTEDRVLIRQGIQAARAYLGAELGGDVRRAVAVDVRNSDPGSHSVGEGGGGTVILYVSHPQWKQTPAFARTKITAHEYAHELQGELTATYAAFTAVPAWLLEGSAEYVAFEAIAAKGLVARDDVHDAQVWHVHYTTNSLPSLQTLESRSTFYSTEGAVYGLAYLAVERLVASRGVGALRPFLVAVGEGTDWRSAFKSAFGVSVDTFYTSFATYRSNLQPPATYPAAFVVPPPACTKTTPALKLSPTKGKVSTMVTASLTGYPKNQTLTVTWSGRKVATVTTSASGTATVAFKVPAATGGGHKVAASGPILSASATFTVVPSLVLTPLEGSTGTSVKVTLRGFAKDEKVTVKWYKTATSTTTLKSGLVVASNGGASFTFTVPSGTAGEHKIEAIGSKGSKASRTFTLGPSAASIAEEPSPTASAQPTEPPATSTPTARPTREPRATRTPTATPTPTETPTPEPTATPVPTETPAPTEPPTVEPTPEQPDGSDEASAVARRLS